MALDVMSEAFIYYRRPVREVGILLSFTSQDGSGHFMWLVLLKCLQSVM